MPEPWTVPLPMTRTRIKICGTRRTRDALAAAEHGADAIGLVFHPPSPRAIEPRDARILVEALPPFVTVVALFLDPDADDVNRILHQVPVDVLQFHGREPEDFCRGFDRPYIKAAGMAGEDPADVARAHPRARALLVDSHAPGAAGGSGRAFAWDRLPGTRDYHLVLAGGLTADNVAEAVRMVRPAGVDVSSGVELQPGIKDETRIRRFIEEVRRGDRNQEPDSR